MDRIEKALARLTERERVLVRAILERLSRGDHQGFNIKKLKGRDDIFRVRKGDFRILYRVEGSAIFVLAIERRSEKTYRGL